MIGYIDQPTHGSVLDIIEQDAEISFQAVDYDNFQPGKPFKSGQLSIPETANNRAIIGSLFDADGAAKQRIIPNATYQNDAISLQGSIVITAQTYKDRINVLTGFFVSGTALLWLDFGDTNMQDLDWSEYNHVLSYTTVTGSNFTAISGLTSYDLCDRGKFIDAGTVNLIERYPAFNVAEMLRLIFKGYDLKGNIFTVNNWFAYIYEMFTGSSDIRNNEDWQETSLLSGEGDCTKNQDVPITATTNPFLIEQTSDMDFTDPLFDNGPNWNAGNYYLVPETGTYRFKATVTGGVDIRTGSLTQPPTNSLVSTELNLKIISANLGTIALYQKIDATPTNPGREINLDIDLDTDFIELQKDDQISFYTSYDGAVQNTTFPTTWYARIYTAFAVTNQVSRYYGYGSTVEIAKLMPNMKVNEWLSDLFSHFAIIPQYSNETNIVRLDTWQKQTTGVDLSYSLDPLTAEADYMEPFSYEVRFADDSSDAYGQDWFKRNKAEDGNYIADNGEKVLRIFQSAYSNTVVQKSYQLLVGTDPQVKIPVFWQDVPKSEPFKPEILADLPAWRTNFNRRLLVYMGFTAEEFQFGYHNPGSGRAVTSIQYVQFAPYDWESLVSVEFADRTGYIGLHERCHKAQIARINNGISLTIQGVIDSTYLNNLINCDETVNMRTAIYINFDPFIGFYTVQKVTTDGIISQLQLIRNDE